VTTSESLPQRLNRSEKKPFMSELKLQPSSKKGVATQSLGAVQSKDQVWTRHPGGGAAMIEGSRKEVRTAEDK